MEDKKPLSVMEDKKAAVTVASEAAAAEEPNELNVRLLEEGKDDAAARLAASNLAQNVRDESSDFSRMRQVNFIISSEIQGGPSGRGQSFVDIEIRVALQYKKFILQRNFQLYVNKLYSATRWATLYSTTTRFCYF